MIKNRPQRANRRRTATRLRRTDLHIHPGLVEVIGLLLVPSIRHRSGSHLPPPPAPPVPATLAPPLFDNGAAPQLIDAHFPLSSRLPPLRRDATELPCCR